MAYNTLPANNIVAPCRSAGGQILKILWTPTQPVGRPALQGNPSSQHLWPLPRFAWPAAAASDIPGLPSAKTASVSAAGFRVQACQEMCTSVCRLLAACSRKIPGVHEKKTSTLPYSKGRRVMIYPAARSEPARPAPPASPRRPPHGLWVCRKLTSTHAASSSFIGQFWDACFLATWISKDKASHDRLRQHT